MTMGRRLGLFLLLTCGGISIFYGSAYAVKASGSPDFRALYYGTRCLLQHQNPYNESELESVYRSEGGERATDTFRQRQVVTLYVNLPTTFLFVAPLAILPWGVAQAVWLTLLAGLFLLAGWLMWRLGGKYAPGVTTLLICIVLINSEVVFAGGNSAGLVVSLCVVAVWCFLEERFVTAGVLCMAVSLAIKPHDSGLVWLYFLLSGGVYRKRALQTLAVTAVLAVAAILWVSQVAPHWMQDWGSNMAAIKSHGGMNDPGTVSAATRDVDLVIDLQSVISVFRDDPRFYNPATYLICGTMLAAWSIRTLRLRLSQKGAWLAIAAVVPLTMLVTYHRPWDAKLLLLTVPACAMLWAEGGLTGWLALVVTAAGVVSTGDIPLVILSILSGKLHTSTATLYGQMLAAVLIHPVPLILLMMSVFYLWVYMRRAAPDKGRRHEGRTAQQDDSKVAQSFSGTR
jgi:hypothetical protein